MRILFFGSKKNDREIDNAREIINSVKSRLAWVHQLDAEDILDFFDAVAVFWSKDAKLLAKFPYLKALSRFIKKENFAKILNFALRGDYEILDKFAEYGGVKYHCQPRGLVVHWLAGNASLLGFYSLFQAMVTKNVSVVKPSSKSYKDFLDLLESMALVNTKKIKGGEFLKNVAVVLVDRNDIAVQTELSKNADVRIAWGGKEAIESISKLPKNVYGEDIMLGPKYSLGIVDKESLGGYGEIAKKLALDICTFDQYACSSPHTVFVEEGGKTTVEDFAKELAQALDFVGKKMLKKAASDPQKNMDILAVRAKYSMTGKVFASKGTEWTVILTKEPGLAPAYASRIIFVKPIKSIREITRFIDRGQQTMGTALIGKDREKLLDDLTFFGIDRCPPFGEMTFFESPWDGMFIMDRLVRWVSYGD